MVTNRWLLTDGYHLKGIKMPNSSQAKKRKNRNRSAEVLDAARELFFSRGYRGTTMQKIAEHAGYSKRTVYLDYLNKDELFVSVCSEGLELLLERLEAIPCEELSIEECVNRMVEVYIEFSRSSSEYFRMIFSEATPQNIANCSGELRERIARLERACLGALEALAERAAREGFISPIDPKEAAGIFVGSATGIILLSMGGSQTVFTKETLESLVKKSILLIWAGMRAPDAFDRGDNG